MIKILGILRHILPLLPYILFVFLNCKTNLKKPIRDRQFPMPVLALIYGIVLLIFASRLGDLILSLIDKIPQLIVSLSTLVSKVSFLSSLQPKLLAFAETAADAIARIDIPLIVMIVLNTLIMLAHIILKRILLVIFKRTFKSGRVHDVLAGLFYEYDEPTDSWYVKPEMGQARTYMKVFYWCAAAISLLVCALVINLYKERVLAGLFYPAFAVIVIGEIWFFLSGITKDEAASDLSGEEDDAERIHNYIVLRKVLRKLFGDKLAAEDTSTNYELESVVSNSDILDEMENSNDSVLEAYSIFMRRWLRSGNDFDQNYLLSGRDLLEGKSILFNDPFYYDLIPYASYAMNRTLLRHKKVLVILGRHGLEKDIEKWCEAGLRAVTNVEQMWDIKVLSGEAANPDVGILNRSDINDFTVQEENSEFFREVEFVVLIEPSKLVTTAQIGLNSIVRKCSRDGKHITYCSTDKNCDGLVDALSHILMTNLTEVSATSKHSGVCSYMCWTPDSDILQHRMLPNLSRYLGVGTELSFAAIKNKVSETKWYGGEAFPVEDMNWIANQYYYDLLHYASLPATKDLMERSFKVSHNLWDARKAESGYFTIEDESNNMFEVKRCFSTRATEQSFINVISPQYLLHDYMGANNSIFDADAKAIPYIVADYARTRRNVILRVCLRMSRGFIPVAEIRKELLLIDVDTDKVMNSLWHELCTISSTSGEAKLNELGEEVMPLGGRDYPSSVIQTRKKYSVSSGRMEEYARIVDESFSKALLGDLENAKYIAEDEEGKTSYLGTELKGHVFQKYLPGQFFTLAGKYYEMLSVTSDGRVLVRRAADHINGRPVYRQQRNYFISGVRDSAEIGSSRTAGGMRVVRQNADIRVETPLYWDMRARNDFETAKKTVINGIPERSFRNKQILRIDFPGAEGFTTEIRDTVAQLINELFVTLFADNACYISAVTAGECSVPVTYSIRGEGGSVADGNAIYIIEDSQLDLGLIVAVERNLGRIFSIISDYLGWHFEELERSMNPEPQPVAPQPAENGESEAKPEKKKNIFRRIWEAIKSFFRKIKEFFAKLFKKKPRKDAPADAAEGEEGLKPEEADDAAEVQADMPVEDGADAIVTEEIDPEADGPEAEALEDYDAEGEEGLEAEDPEAEEDTEVLEDFEEPPVLAKTAGSNADTVAEEQPEAETPAEAAAEEGEVKFGFEADDAVKAGRKFIMEPAPYHLRYYLLFGGTDVPQTLDLDGTLKFLHSLGFYGGELKDAREGINTAAEIERGTAEDGKVSRTCDFCGAEINGVEYEVLKDGRERCTHCSRTAIKSEEELKKLYSEVVSTMEAFYSITIKAPISVKMVNSKKLHKAIGRSFVPTGGYDGRVLGFARQEKDNTYTLYIENGAPRMQSIMTMVHEMTHIWQYLNWDRKVIRKTYGKAQELEIYEGMAMWSEIQYAYLMGESGTALREEVNTIARNDEYGRGFRMYIAKYPISHCTYLKGSTPFDSKDKPI